MVRVVGCLQVKDSYTKNNTVAFEHENRGAGREFVPQKALQARLAEQNAVFSFGGGMTPHRALKSVYTLQLTVS